MNDLVADTAESDFAQFGLKGFMNILAIIFAIIFFCDYNSACFVCVRIVLHCVGSQFPHVSAAEPEPLASSLQSPAGSSVVPNLVPEATWPPETQSKAT